MAYAQPAAWYTHSGDGSTTGYWAIPQFAASTAYVVGQLVRPLTAVAVGSERVYVCIVAGTSGTEPVWTFGKGAIQPITGTATFQECSGEPGLNGDLVNCPVWAINSNPALGRVIYVASNNSIQICNVSSGNGINGAAPAFSATAGVITFDVNNRWTCLGLATAWPAWKSPCARLGVAVSAGWGALGNDFYLADNSFETTNVAPLYNTGSTTTPSRYMSIDHTVTAMPPASSAMKAGASITSSAAASNALVLGSVSSIWFYWYGVSFIVTGNAGGLLLVVGNGNSIRLRFDSCSFINNSPNAGAAISFGPTSTGDVYAEYVNCSVGYNNAGHIAQFSGGYHFWRASTALITGSTLPTTAFRGAASAPATVLFDGLDLSALGANALFNNATPGLFATVKNCRLHASTTMVGALGLGMGPFNIDLVNSDSGTRISRNERYNLNGTQTTATTVYRAGGATESGVGISHLIVPTTFSRVYAPLNGLPLVIWNDLVGSPRTLTVYGCCDVLTTPPTNAVIWIDVEYMGSSTTPVGSFVSSGLATQLDTPTSYSFDSSSTWTGSIQSGSRFAMSVTFTPQQRGNIYVYPRGVGTTRVILDPQPVIT